MKKQNETKKPTISTTILTDGNGLPSGVVFESANGDKIEVILKSLDEQTRLYAACHGIKQKCVDAAALSRNPLTGASATVADKWRELVEVAERINNGGGWNAKRGDGEPSGGLLLMALIELNPNKTREWLVEWLNTKTNADKAALRGNPKIAPIIDRIRAAKVSTTIDTDNLLKEIM